MKRRMAGLLVLVGVCLLQETAVGQRPAPSPVLRALREEADRALAVFKKESDPAYFIGYEVNETRNFNIQADRGSLLSSDELKQRILDIDVRVGDYALDNTHEIRNTGRGGAAAPPIGTVIMPVEDNLDALKSVIWLETDRQYKSAVQRLTQVKANRAIKVDEADTSADLSRETAQTAAMPLTNTDVKASEWEAKVKAYSALFSKVPEILDGWAQFTGTANNQYVVDSEGTSVQSGTIQYRISLYVGSKAEDGMDLYRFESFDAHSIAGLPSDETVRKVADKMVADLKALRKAPLIEPFTGPAILSGRASGVFFHEIFGHRVEGHRQKNEDEGQTFTKQLGKPILPEFISVIDDPTTEKMAGVDLNGYYHFDDEGVKAQPVTIVENGILRNFLLSRSPVAGFEQSNGHGRKEAGYRVVGRQGNLIIKASSTVTDAKLRDMLKEEAKKQGKEFGLLFEDISGGFTSTGRGGPQSFQVTPIMVYKIFVDGRPDELVRGADLIGTPLTSFSKIVAANDKPEVFNGYCGAESGSVPVAAISPGILTTQIEVQKKAKSSDRAPILPAPIASGPATPSGGLQ